MADRHAGSVSQLLEACHAGDKYKIIKLAKRCGKDILVQAGAKPLMICCEKEYEELVPYFVDRFSGVINMNVDNKDGLSISHIVCKTGNFRNCAFLLGRGEQEISFSNSARNGWTPLHFFVQHEGSTNSPIEYRNIMKKLIERSNIDQQNQAGNTALHIAVIAKQVTAINLLIMAHANVNIENFVGHTPLHCAAIRNSNFIPSLLLLSNADPTITNICGENVYDISKKSNNPIMKAALQKWKIQQEKNVIPVEPSTVSFPYLVQTHTAISDPSGTEKNHAHKIRNQITANQKKEAGGTASFPHIFKRTPSAPLQCISPDHGDLNSDQKTEPLNRPRAPGLRYKQKEIQMIIIEGPQETEETFTCCGTCCANVLQKMDDSDLLWWKENSWRCGVCCDFHCDIPMNYFFATPYFYDSKVADAKLSSDLCIAANSCYVRGLLLFKVIHETKMVEVNAEIFTVGAWVEVVRQDMEKLIKNWNNETEQFSFEGILYNRFPDVYPSSLFLSCTLITQKEGKRPIIGLAGNSLLAADQKEGIPVTRLKAFFSEYRSFC